MSSLLDFSDLPETVGIIPLRNAVLFPGGVLPLSLTEDANQEVDLALDGYVLVVAVRESSQKVAAADLFEVGTLSRIVKIDQARGQYQLVVQGLARCHVRRSLDQPALLRSRVDPIPIDDFLLDEASTEKIRSLGLQLIHRSTGLPEEARSLFRDIEEPRHLIDLLIANSGAEVSEKQLVLESVSVEDRAVLAMRLLTSMLARLPVPPLTGSQCSVHGVPAVATCARCGAFICDGCRGPGGTRDWCKQCRSRDERSTPSQIPVNGYMRDTAMGSLSLAVISLVCWRLFWPGAQLELMTCGLAGVATSLGSFWYGRHLPRRSADWGTWMALLGLGLNAVVALRAGFAVFLARLG